MFVNFELQQLLNWNGYDLIGVLLSLGGGLYAFLANRNAKKAAATVEKALAKFTSVDAVVEIGLLQGRVTQIRLRLELQDLTRASECCSEIQVGAAKISKTTTIALSSNAAKDLTSLKSTAASLAKLIDSALHNDVPLDGSKVSSMLTKIDHGLMAVQLELKETVTVNE